MEYLYIPGSPHNFCTIRVFEKKVGGGSVT